MSESKSRKLPPLGPPKTPRTDTDETGETPRQRKKKKYTDQDGEISPRRRPRSSSRQRPEILEDEDGEIRTKSKRSRSRSGSASRSRENLPDYDTRGVANRPKKKKPKTKDLGTSHEQLVGSGEFVEVPDESASPVKRRRKKKKKPRSSEGEELDEEGDLGLAADLTEIQDDVVVADTLEAPEEAKWVAPVMRSEPVSRVFIEQKGGFKSADKTKLAKRQAEQQARALEATVEEPTQTTIQFALATHRVFKTFSLFCHGLLAGFALWQIIMVYSLSGHGYTSFLVYYQPVALPVQSLYYLLLVICTVSVCDRYDIGQPTRRFIVRAFTLQSGAISVLIYVMALVFSLSIAAIDDKINLNRDDLWDTETERDHELNTWRVLNLIRGIGAILGWIIVSLKPNTDRLTKNLEKANENMLEFAEPVEMVLFDDTHLICSGDAGEKG